MSVLYKKIFSSFVNQQKNFLQLLLCHSLVRQQVSSSKNNGRFSRSLFVFAAVLLSALSFTSCEKVINIDLNSAEKKYVIEGAITDHNNSCKVLVSETKDFQNDNNFSGVSGAQVTVSDNNGNSEPLTETSPGVYELSTLTGVAGHTYKLTVKVSGKVFTASSTMPAKVPLDSIYIIDRSIFGESNKYATVNYTDPVGKGDAYRFIEYVNGVKEKTIFVRDDDLTDGRAITRDLIPFQEGNDQDEEDKKKLKPGDRVDVEMLCLDYPVYKYWYSLSQSSLGNNQSATPANPVTNIEGGALGYFSVHTIQAGSVIVP